MIYVPNLENFEGLRLLAKLGLEFVDNKDCTETALALNELIRTGIIAFASEDAEDGVTSDMINEANVLYSLQHIVNVCITNLNDNDQVNRFIDIANLVFEGISTIDNVTAIIDFAKLTRTYSTGDVGIEDIVAIVDKVDSFTTPIAKLVAQRTALNILVTTGRWTTLLNDKIMQITEDFVNSSANTRSLAEGIIFDQLFYRANAE